MSPASLPIANCRSRTADRELPIIWEIAVGSLRNKLLFLLPAALILSAFAPFLITPILMLGGAGTIVTGSSRAGCHFEGRPRLVSASVRQGNINTD